MLRSQGSHRRASGRTAYRVASVSAPTPLGQQHWSVPPGALLGTPRSSLTLSLGRPSHVRVPRSGAFPASDGGWAVEIAGYRQLLQIASLVPEWAGAMFAPSAFGGTGRRDGDVFRTLCATLTGAGFAGEGQAAHERKAGITHDGTPLAAQGPNHAIAAVRFRQASTAWGDSAQSVPPTRLCGSVRRVETPCTTGTDPLSRVSGTKSNRSMAVSGWQWGGGPPVGATHHTAAQHATTAFAGV